MQIHALTTGHVQIKTRHLHAKFGSRLERAAALFRDPVWSDWLPIHTWLIEHPEGLILVDTGDLSRRPPGLAHPFSTFNTRKRVRPEDEIGPQLSSLGVAPSSVGRVVLTHLHVDHDGGVQQLPNSEFLVARGEYEAARGTAGRLRGYYPQRWPLNWRPTLLELPAVPFGPFTHSLPLTKAGDVLLVPTPGHTAHHLSVVVKEGERLVFLAGDASYSEQGMLEGWPDGVGPSAAQMAGTLERVRALCETHPTVYLPTHDPEAAGRLERRQAVRVLEGAQAGVIRKNPALLESGVGV